MGKDLRPEFSLWTHLVVKRTYSCKLPSAYIQHAQRVCIDTSQINKQKNVSQARMRKDCFYIRKDNVTEGRELSAVLLGETKH